MLMVLLYTGNRSLSITNVHFQSNECLFNAHLISFTDLPAGKYPGKYTLPRHNAFTGLFINRAPRVALFSDLSDFQQDSPCPQLRTHRQRFEVNTAYQKIFSVCK